MNRIKSLLTNKAMYVGLAVGLLLGVAYAAKLGIVRKIAGYLPGSATKFA